MIRLLAALLLLLAPAAASAKPGDLVQRERISVRDEGGTGTAVILIPGLASPRAVYAGVVPQLIKTHRVFTVQVNGFGGDDPRGNLRPGVLDGIVADLAAVIAERKLDRPAVVGHSMGGLVATVLAARHPASVGRLMVVDALPFIGVLFDSAATPASVAPQAARMREMTAAGHGRPSAPITADPGGIWSNTATGRIQVAEWGRAADQRVVAQALYEDMTTDVTPELARITARPFTVLYAAGAGPQAAALWRRAYAGSPATLVAVPDSWHFIMLDQPAAFARALSGFLSAR